MKILHVLYQSLPNAKGSSIRSRDIVASQLSNGLMPVVISSPFQEGFKDGQHTEVYAGVKYYRTFNGNSGQAVSESRKSVVQRVSKAFQIFPFIRDVFRVASLEQVDVVHAHAMFFCGVAGWAAARRLGVPFVYEVRSLWEERPNQTATLLDRLISRFLRVVETSVMRLADRVVVINKNLRNEIIGRGIAPEKVVVIENGVDIERIERLYLEPKKRAGSDIVIGYVGSISPIEGLDLLLESIRELRKNGWSNPVVFYGDGPATLQLKKMANEWQLAGVHFKGPFSTEDVGSVYSEVDIIINPRRRSHLTDSVTPLKPLEAMAFKKMVIVSDIGGMRELVTHKDTGLIFDADSAASLAEALKLATAQYEENAQIVANGRKYVEKCRSWSVNGARYADLYRSITN